MLSSSVMKPEEFLGSTVEKAHQMAKKAGEVFKVADPAYENLAKAEPLKTVLSTEPIPVPANYVRVNDEHNRRIVKLSIRFNETEEVVRVFDLQRPLNIGIKVEKFV